MAYNEGVVPGWHIVARWAESQYFSGLSRVRGPVWFTTLPDDIRESITSAISDRVKYKWGRQRNTVAW